MMLEATISFNSPKGFYLPSTSLRTMTPKGGSDTLM